MTLSSIQLEAFHAVSRARSFSLAAKKLGLTQSALSQRVSGLEGELGLSLFVREPRGLRLTEAGEKLLRHCQAREHLEGELVAALKAGDRAAGALRIGGFSTVLWPVVVPALGPWVRKRPGIQLSFLERELAELPTLLRSGECDYILVSEASPRTDIESLLLGHEENVLVESARHPAPPSVYLDHDFEDATTEAFFRSNGKASAAQGLSRSYLDGIHGIVAGLEQGWGRAVIPRHLLRAHPGLRAVKGFKPQRVPVYLLFYRQPYYSRLHAEVVDILKEEIGRRLAP